jgi:hypothetical protein
MYDFFKKKTRILNEFYYDLSQPLKLMQMQMPFEKFNEHHGMKGVAVVIKFRFARAVPFHCFSSIILCLAPKNRTRRTVLS